MGDTKAHTILESLVLGICMLSYSELKSLGELLGDDLVFNKNAETSQSRFSKYQTI